MNGVRAVGSLLDSCLIALLSVRPQIELSLYPHSFLCVMGMVLNLIGGYWGSQGKVFPRLWVAAECEMCDMFRFEHM